MSVPSLSSTKGASDAHKKSTLAVIGSHLENLFAFYIEYPFWRAALSRNSRISNVLLCTLRFDRRPLSMEPILRYFPLVWYRLPFFMNKNVKTKNSVNSSWSANLCYLCDIFQTGYFFVRFPPRYVCSWIGTKYFTGYGIRSLSNQTNYVFFGSKTPLNFHTIRFDWKQSSSF